jgi:hypothetical protein
VASLPVSTGYDSGGAERRTKKGASPLPPRTPLVALAFQSVPLTYQNTIEQDRSFEENEQRDDSNNLLLSHHPCSLCSSAAAAVQS